MRRRLTFTLFAAAGLCRLFGQLSSPQAGTVRFSDGTVRRLLGIGNSYVIGPVLLSGIKAAAFSDSYGLVTDGSRIALVQAGSGSVLASYSSTEAHPVFGISSGPESAAVWLPSDSRLLIVEEQGFVPVAVSLPSGALSEFYRSGNEVEFERLDGDVHERLRVRIDSGELVSRVDAGSSGSCRLLREGEKVSALCGTDTKALVTTNAGTAVLEQVASHAIHFAAGGQHRLLTQTGTGAWSVSELPTPAGDAR